MKPRPNIKLSTGAIVAHSLESNGSQRARVVGRIHGGMTEGEWAEYCELLKLTPDTEPESTPAPVAKMKFTEAAEYWAAVRKDRQTVGK